MAVTIRHSFVSAVADGSSLSKVKPSAWNANHVVEGFFGVTPQDYGAIANNNEHPITQADIDAHPNWIGTYNVGTSWDTVGMQEAIYACFATNSTPGNVIWNAPTGHTALNKYLFIPNGQYWINRGLLIVAQNFQIDGETRGLAMLIWHGDSSISMLTTDSISYGSMKNITLTVGFGGLSIAPLWDMNGTGTHGGLRTQQITLYDTMVLGNNLASRGIYISRAGGAAQGDTIVFVNPYVSSLMSAGITIGGQNALSVVFIGGDIQACRKDGIEVIGGTAQVYGTSFQGQAAGFTTTPPSNQVVNLGADFHQYGGAGPTNISILDGVRSESEILMQDISGYTSVRESGIAQAGMSGWFSSFPFVRGYLLGPGNQTKNRAFIVVDGSNDGSGTGLNIGYRRMTDVLSVTTIEDSAASYTVNGLVGYGIYLRFSNGFTEHWPVTSNTATTITFADRTGGLFNTNCTYTLAGYTGAVEPSFDSAPDGNYAHGVGGATFTIAAGSDQLSGAVPPIGQYVCIGGADIVGVPYGVDGNINPQRTTALIAKVTNIIAGVGTLDRVAGQSVTNAFGYYGQGFVADDVTYMEVPFHVISRPFQLSHTFANFGNVYDPTSIRNYSTSKPQWLVGINTSIGVNLDVLREVNKVIYQGLPTNVSPLDLTDAFGRADIFTFTPTQDVTFNAPAQVLDNAFYGAISRRIVFHIITSGVTSYTLTWGTNFKSTGTLVTGIVDSVRFVIAFEYAGGFWTEVSRTTAM